jgi:hypothetical protein
MSWQSNKQKPGINITTLFNQLKNKQNDNKKTV